MNRVQLRPTLSKCSPLGRSHWLGAQMLCTDLRVVVSIMMIDGATGQGSLTRQLSVVLPLPDCAVTSVVTTWAAMRSVWLKNCSSSGENQRAVAGGKVLT